MPASIKKRVHDNRTLDTALRRFYGKLLGGGSSVIPEGPMKGLRLAHSEHVSHAHFRGVYESDLLEAIARELKPGMVCYDIGASIGYISILMARQAKKVFAFEPAPHAAAEIKRQSGANNFTNIEIVPLPVSDSVREVTFSLTDVAYGSAILDDPSGRWKVLKLKTTTLDTFAETHEAPDLIKMDIEGEEGRAMEGARNLLMTKRPVVVCEVHGVEPATHVKRVLTECGYDVLELDGSREFRVESRDEILAGAVQVLGRPRSAGRR